MDASRGSRFIRATAHDPLGLAYRVMILSGCRRAELVGFRWAYADLEVPYRDPDTGGERLGAVLTVRRPVLQLGGRLHEEATAKSRAGDRLVFLDQGRLVAQGTHAGLLAAGGLYAQLYHRQFRTQHAPDTAGPQPVPAEGQPLLQPAAPTAR